MKQFFKLSITSVFVAGILLSAHVVEAIPTYEDACQVPLISRGLSAGSQNEDVLDLQNFLIQQKYLAPSAVSGYFGPLTRQAVRDFQRANNIVSSGTAATTGYGAVGVKTRAAINTIACTEAGGGTGSGGTTNNPTSESNSPGTVSFSADGQTSVKVTPGSAVTLTWQTNPANNFLENCTASGAWSGVKLGSGYQVVNPTTNSTYTLSCTFRRGNAAENLPINSFYTKTANVVVETGGVNTGGGTETGGPTISANKQSITSGESVIISWTVGSSPLSCSLSNTLGTSYTTSGSMTVNPTVTTTYRIICSYNTNASDNYGMKSASVTIVVGNSGGSNQLPTLTLNGQTGTVSVLSGERAMLTWKASTRTNDTCSGTGATGVDISNWNRPLEGVGGSFWIYPTQTTTYTINCSNGSSGIVSASVTANVGGGGGNPTLGVVTLKANGSDGPVSLSTMGPVILSWTVNPATADCRGSANPTGLYGFGGGAGLSTNNGSGSLQIPLVRSTTVFTITCTPSGGGQSFSDSVTVNVGGDTGGGGDTGTGPRITSFTVTPGKVLSLGNPSFGSPAIQEFTFNWSSVNTAYCAGISGPNEWILGQIPTSGSKTIAFSQGGTLTLWCPSGYGPYATTPSDTKTVTIAIDTSSAVGPTVNFSASASTVTPGSPVTLTWSAPNATTCTGGGDLSFSLHVSGTSGSKAVTPLVAGTYTMTLRCVSASNGVTTVSRTVTASGDRLSNPETGNALGVNISANGSEGPINVSPGELITLTWGMSNNSLVSGTGCTVSGDPAFSGPRTPSGQVALNVKQSATYSITCTYWISGITGSDSVTVNIVGGPSATLTANETSVTSGGSTFINWSGKNVDVCMVSGGGINNPGSAISGSISTGQLTQTTTYSLSCYKNVPVNGVYVPSYAPVQTVTVSVGAQNTNPNGSVGQNTDSVDMRVNGSKSAVTNAQSGAVSLTWTLSNTIGYLCSVSGVPGISNVSVNGGTIFARPSVSTSYGITCTSFLTGKTVSDSVSVTVQ